MMRLFGKSLKGIIVGGRRLVCPIHTKERLPRRPDGIGTPRNDFWDGLISTLRTHSPAKTGQSTRPFIGEEIASSRRNRNSQRRFEGYSTSPMVIASVIILILSVSVFAQEKKKLSKEMCITFNELPASQGFAEVDVKGANSLILESLKNHEVKAAGFVVGSYIGKNFDILGDWLNGGHTLGSMTNSNQDFHMIDAQSFTKDIASGAQAMETMLAGFGQKKRYFRFPYLHYGTRFEDKDAAMIFLENQKTMVAHATILVDDYLFNLTLEKMGKKPDSSRIEQLRYEYLEHVETEIEAAEYKAKDLLGKNCRQILLLRANRLNAIFLEDILTLIEDLEYKFVTLDRALKDPLYVKAEAYFGALGVGYLDMILQSDPDMLPAE